MTTGSLPASRLPVTSLAFTPWPKKEAEKYRANNIWQGVSIPHELARLARSFPNRTAIICGGRQYSYRDLHDEITSVAQGFLNLGLMYGQKAVIHMPNTAEFYISFLALLRIGVRPVLALPAHRESELIYFCQASQASLFITAMQNGFDAIECASNISKALDGHMAVVVADGPDSIDSAKVDLVILKKQTKSMIHFSKLYVAKSKVMKEKIDQHLPSEASLMALDFAFFQLSGGTTGTAKLIPRSHDDYWYSVRASVDVCQFDKNTRYLCVLPAAHNFPLSSPGALGCFSVGACVILAHDPSAQTSFTLIAKHQVTVAALVPPLLLVWMDLVTEKQYDISSLQLVQVGGARLSMNSAKRVVSELNCQLQQVFGMAEGLVNYTRLDDPLSEIIESQGRPMSDFDQIKIADDQGNEVATGERGVLLVKGPYTIRGYYQAPEHNQRSFNEDGFYITGDIVRLTPAGNIQVVGRDKDQINRGGEKIAAEEIENYLLAHPAIHNAALVPINDEYMGEKSCAVLECQGDKPKVFEIKRYLRQQKLADYKIPDRIEFIETLPKTPVGKINKKLLTLQFS